MYITAVIIIMITTILKNMYDNNNNDNENWTKLMEILVSTKHREILNSFFFYNVLKLDNKKNLLHYAS